jgi:hypothetical protein
MDVKTAFLDEEVDEKIYINQTEGFEISDEKDKMCKFKKNLYMTSNKYQSSDMRMFDTTMTQAGFVVNEADKSVYYRYGGGRGVIMCLYVDNILIFRILTL